MNTHALQAQHTCPIMGLMSLSAYGSSQVGVNIPEYLHTHWYGYQSAFCLVERLNTLAHACSRGQLGTVGATAKKMSGNLV